MAKPTLRRLLSAGFFPPGIPQPFTTAKFGAALTRRNITLPAEFEISRKNKFRRALLGRHNLARVGQLRRALGIPNPIHQFNLCKELVTAWSQVAGHIRSDDLSITSPRASPSGERSITAKVEHPERPGVRASKRISGRYLLIADVQQCFPSIYTHSIPWALHTKQVAKQRQRDMTLLGNRLDFWVRQAQDGQTKGIPIGPDTSLIIAEIIFAAIDTELQQRVGPLKGLRAVDDFELIFGDLGTAESALTAFQTTLDSWELKPNESKTKILELPIPYDDLWPVQLRRLEIETGPKQTNDILDFFSFAFQLARENATSSVVRYAISRMGSIDVTEQAWPTYQSILLQCAMAEPGVLPYVAGELSKYKARERPLDIPAIRSVISELILRHLPLGHGSEVAWALWLSIALRLEVSAAVGSVLPETNDFFVPLLALDASKKNLFAEPLQLNRWRAKMTSDELWGENWLLAYEANIKGWLPSAGHIDHVSADPCFQVLKQAQVSFYRDNAVISPVRRWRPRFTLSGEVGSPGIDKDFEDLMERIKDD